MAIPDLNTSDIRSLVPNSQDVLELDRGGQKIVFSATIDGTRYAIKALRANPIDPAIGDESDVLDDVTARAQREVETMQQCDTPHLVKMGPIGLTTGTVRGQQVIYYTEEFIEGQNLWSYLRSHGPMDVQELAILGTHIAQGIRAIWQFSKIHRDIKPGNIMRRNSGEFILLDMGLVFDLTDESLSVSPVGTPKYFSPEQLNFVQRRTVLDFRSDLFSLGIVLYEMSTGTHPFAPSKGLTTWEVIGNIHNLHPPAPSRVVSTLPSEFDRVVMRMLGKKPALRYRSIDLFIRDLNNLMGGS